MESSKQLQDYIRVIRARNAVRGAIDRAKDSGDVDSEWINRQRMGRVWTKRLHLAKELHSQYETKPEQLRTDVRAAYLLKYGKSMN